MFSYFFYFKLLLRTIFIIVFVDSSALKCYKLSMACILSSQWDIIRTELLKSPNRNGLVCDIATHIGQKWSNTLEFKCLSEYLVLSFDELYEIPGLGEGKIQVLLLCVLQAYLNELVSTSSTIPLISSNWDVMVKALSESSIKEEPIIRLANKLGLKWPVSRQDDLIKNYIHFSLHEIQSLPGFGTKKTEVIVKCIEKAYQEIKDYIAPSDMLLSFNELCEAIKSSINSRNTAIWLRRYNQNRKLSEIGDEYSLTKERVRQLIDKTNETISSLFESEIKELLRIIGEEINCTGYHNVENLIRFYAIEDRSIFNALLIMLQNEQESFIIRDGYIFLWETDFDKLSDMVFRYLFKSTYPIDINKLGTQFPFQPLDFLIRLINKKYIFHTDNSYGYFSNLPTNQQCYYALVTKEATMSTEEIQEFIKKYFQIEPHSHVIQASIGRISELYIFDRGKYILEQFLNLSSDDLKCLTELCYKRIKNLGDFIKANILYDELMFNFPHYKNKDVTPYLLLSLLQKDNRFKTSPGLMIGLTSFDDVESLNELVKKIIIESGPITVPEIQEILEEKYFRKVLAVTLKPIVDKNIDIIQIERGKFDYIYKYIADVFALDKIIKAMQMILMEKSMSAYSVFSHFRLINELGLNEQIVKSIMISSDKFSQERELFFLSKPDPEIRDYYFSTMPHIENHDKMIMYVKEKWGDSYLEFVEIDYRLKTKKIQREENSPLEEILKEYGF